MASKENHLQSTQYRKTRTYRAGDDLYEAAKAKAKERGETLTGVITRFLEIYAGAKDAPEKRSDRGLPRNAGEPDDTPEET